MVRKSEKFGVNSGNTFRASNCKYNRLYKTKTSLVRNTKNSDSTETILDDLAIDFDGIEYSLNKKGRWLIPQMIKEDILENKKHLTKDLKVQLFESHKIKRKARCVGYYASKGPIRKVVAKKTYFDAKSLNNPRRNKSKRKTRRSRTLYGNTDVAYDAQEPSPELNIEIFYPSPSTSSITHNPKYIRNWIPPWKTAVDEDNQRSKMKTPLKTKRRARISSKCIDENLLTYQEDSGEENDEDLHDRCSSEHRSLNVKLEDIFVHAFKMRSLCTLTNNSIRNDDNQDKNVKSMTSTKSANEDSEQLVPEDLPKESKKWQMTEMLPVYVILSSADIQPENLREIYGSSYMECQCFPRKFVIDITDRITGFSRKSKAMQGKPYSVDLKASIIFEYDMNADDGPDGNVYKVYLNLKSKLELLQIETIADFEQTTIDEVIQRTAFFVETIPVESFYTVGKTSQCNKKEIKFQHLDECLGSLTEAYYPSSKLLYKDVFRNKNDGLAPDSLLELGFECVPPNTCYICFESICNGDKAATALQTCGHWFCNECWNDHILSKMDMGNYRIKCPEYKCTGLVDNATKLTLVNIRCVEQLAKREHDAKVDMHRETKWCPDPYCGRVLKVNKLTKSLNVKCACGKIICFDCLQPAHWPASCDFTVTYWSKLQDSGYKDVPQEKFVTSTFEVCGKNCPQCFRFIEKLGGCNHMTCCCGAEFCWACLKLFSDHSAITCRTADDKVGAKKVKIRSYAHDGIMLSSNYTKLHKMAVRHRVNRHSWNTQFMKSNMWLLSSMLKAYIKKRGNEYGMELSEYTKTDNIQKHIEKVPAFLSGMLDLYMEMNYVIEYTAVYLQENQNRGKSDIMPVLERLVYLSAAIYEIFNSGSDQDVRLVISNLWELRQHSKHNIDGLVRIVTRKGETEERDSQSDNETIERDLQSDNKRIERDLQSDNKRIERDLQSDNETIERDLQSDNETKVRPSQGDNEAKERDLKSDYETSDSEDGDFVLL